MKYVHPRYSRITIDPDICTGKPCIRGIQFPVTSLLAYLSSGMTYEELLSEFPFLEREEIFDVLSFSSEMLHDNFFSASEGCLSMKFLLDVNRFTSLGYI